MDETGRMQCVKSAAELSTQLDNCADIASELGAVGLHRSRRYVIHPQMEWMLPAMNFGSLGIDVGESRSSV